MNTRLCFALAALVCVGFLPATLQAAAIDVGEIQLNPDQAGQNAQFNVTGGEAVTALEFNIEVSDGDNDGGPTMSDIELINGTIFDVGSANQSDNITDPQQRQSSVDVATEDAPNADGVTAIVTFDTTGVQTGRFAVALKNVAGNNDTFYTDTNGQAIQTTITNGSIAIGDTPTVTWTGGGGDTNITTGANWNGFAPPQAGDAIVFTGSGVTVNQDATGTPTVASVTFDGNAGAFTIGGNDANPVGIEDGGAITNNSTNTQTFNVDVDAGGALTFDADSGALQFNNPVELASPLTVQGGANTLIAGAISDESGNGRLVKNESGTLTLSGTNTYGGSTQLNNGTLAVSGGNAIPDGSATTIDGGTLRVDANETIDVLSGTAGTLDLNSRTLTTGANGAGEQTLASGVTGAGQLRKVGGNTLVLSGSNNHSETRLEAGTLGLGSDSAAGGNTLTIAGGSIEARNGARNISDAVSAEGDFGIGGSTDLTLSGGVDLTGGSRAVNVTNTGATELSGALSNGTLVKGGAETLALTGDSSAAGSLNVTVQDGELAADSATALPNTGTVQVGSGGELSTGAAQTLARLTGSGDVSLGTGNGVTVGGSGADADFGGSISGDAGLTKQGANTQTLSGSSSYTGQTTVEAGTLDVTGSITSDAMVNGGELAVGGTVGSATVNDGGTFTGAGQTSGDLLGRGGTVAPGASIGTVNVGGDLDLDGTTSLDLEVAVSGGTPSADLFDVAGAATLADGLTLNVSRDGGDALSGGETFNIVEADGTLTVNPGALTINSNVQDIGFNAQTASNGTNDLQLVAELLNITEWDGDNGDDQWNTATNWVEDTAPADGDRLLFTGFDGGGDTPNNDFAADDLSVAGITFGEDGTPTGPFTLTGNSVVVQAGGDITNDDDSTQTVDLALNANGALVFDAASGDLQINGNVGLASDDLTVRGGNNTTVAGIISGNGGLDKDGGGTARLTADNSFTGDVTVSGGALELANANALENTVGVNLDTSGATLTLDGVNQHVGTLQGVSGTQINLGGNTLTFGAGQNATVASAISGSGGSITKEGSGAVTLSGTNTYDGSTNLNAGTLRFGSDDAIGTSTLEIAGGTTIAAANGARTINETVNVNGSFTVADRDALDLSGTVNVTTGATLTHNNTAGTTISGATTLDLGANALTVDTAASAPLSVTADVTNVGGGSLTKDGDGTLSLSGSNDFTGGVTLNNGALVVGSGSALGDNAGALTIGGDGTASIRAANGAQSVGNPVTVNSDFSVGGSDGLTFNGATTLSGGNRTITVNNTDAPTTFGGVISGDAAGDPDALTKAGAGRIVLNGANTYTGGATLANGTIDIGNNDALGTGTLTIANNANGKTLRAAGGARTIDNTVDVNDDFTIAGSNALEITGVQTIEFGDLGGGTRTVQVDNTATTTFSANVTGTNGTVAKAGAGRLDITADNSAGLDATVRLDNGALGIGHNDALGTGALTIANNANSKTLRAVGGSRTIDNDVNVNDDFAIAGNNNLNIAGGVGTVTFGDLGGTTRTVDVGAGITSTWSATVDASNGTVGKTGDGTLALTGANDGTLSADVQAGAGTLAVSGGGAIGDGSGVTVANGATFDVNADETIGTLAGAGTAALATNTLTTAADGDTAYSGDITGGTFEKGGAGTFALTGTVDGLTVSGGTVAINNGDGDAIDDAVAPQVDATLDVDNSETIAGLTGSASGEVQLASGTTLTVNTGGTPTFNGAITGAGGLTKAGGGTQQLNSAGASYTGQTDVDAGTLQANGGDAVGDGSTVDLTNQAGTTFELIADESIAALSGGGSTGGTVQLNSNTLSIVGDADATFSGTVTDGGGTGALTINNSGTQTFDGTLDFDGGVDVQGGNVDFDTGNQIPGPVTNAGDFTATNGVDGDVTNNAGGTFIANGPIDGDVTNAGRFSGTGPVNGSFTNQAGGVGAPGNSIGTLPVNGNFTVAADSTIEIEVNGTEDDGNTQSDTFDVNAGNGDPGDATLEDGSIVNVIPDENDPDGDGNLEDGDTFTIINAEGSITDNGATFDTSIPLVNFQGAVVTPNGNELYQITADVLQFLQLANNAGANSDQRKTAEQLTQLANAGLDGDGTVVSAVEQTIESVEQAGGDPGAAFLRIADQLGTQAFEPSTRISVENARLFSGAMGNYFSGLRNGNPRAAMRRSVDPERGPMLASAMDPSVLSSIVGANEPVRAGSAQQGDGEGPENPDWFADDGWGGFARGVGIFQDQDSGSDRLGYTADAGGGLFGLDKQLADGLTLGVSAGFLHTDTDLAGGRGDHEIETVRVGPYVSYAPSQWFVDAAVSYGYHSFDSTRRTPGVAGTGSFDSEHDGHDVAAYASTGYDFEFGQLTVTPTGTLHYLYLYEEAFTESGGAGSGALDVDSRSSDSLRSRLGVNFRHPFRGQNITFVPEMFIGWEHEYLDDDEQIDARFVGGGAGSTRSFDVEAGDENSAFFSAGMTALFNEDFSAYLRYDGNYYSDGETHAVSGGLRLEF